MPDQVFIINEPVDASRRFYFMLVDKTDGYTPETGEAGGQPQISIAGASYTNTGDTLTHIGNGTYYIVLTTSEIAALGKFIVRYSSANVQEFQDIGRVEEAISLAQIKQLILELMKSVDFQREQVDKMTNEQREDKRERERKDTEKTKEELKSRTDVRPGSRPGEIGVDSVIDWIKENYA